MALFRSTHAFPSLATLLLVAGCGTAYHLPLEIVEPLPHPDASIRVEDVRLELRAGAEWLELRVVNAGADSVALDLAAVSFVESAGRFHRLASGAQLAQAQQLTWAAATGALLAAAPSDDPLTLLERGHHAPPAILDRSARWVEVIPPGEFLAELFYPMEHLHRDEQLGWRTDPLFCGRGTAAAIAEGREFEVSFPLRTARGWRDVRLVARLKREGS